jgi:hypothetical protein
MMKPDRDIRALFPSLFLVLAVSAFLSGCGDSDSQQSPPSQSQPAQLLPENSQEWVCKDSLTDATQEEIDAWCQSHPDRGQPVPEGLRNPPPPADFANYQAYNLRLKDFLTEKRYEGLGWVHDMRWRFSGPSVVPPTPAGSSDRPNFSHNYGPHFPLLVYYSPEVVDWLCNGRSGAVPDGAMMIKAMTIAFGSLDVRVASDSCMDIVPPTPKPMANENDSTTTIKPNLWAPMIKTSQSSYDGWLWMLQQPDIVPPAPFPPTPIPPQFPPPLLDVSAFTGGTFSTPITDNPFWYPTGSILNTPFLFAFKVPNVVTLIPLAGHSYCLSCHSTAESESTFASMDNILGKELRYKAFETTAPVEPTPTPANFSPFPKPLSQPTPAFQSFFNQLDPVPFAAVWETRMPAETYDQQVTSAHAGPGQFLTSAQCNACHNATPQSPLLPKMVFVEENASGSGPLRNLSPNGEWRVSPMGLAGRDPIFFSQLQSETNNLPQLAACIETTCLHCHGAMGERQLATDTKDQGDEACKTMFAIEPPPEVPFGKPLRRRVLQQWPGSPQADEQKYAALAREGISCAVCHHVSATDMGQERTYTGNFVTGPADKMYGPYKDDTIATKPMEHALGIAPTFGEQIVSSELCGSCHNVLLPIFDNSGQRRDAAYEQSTHLEWLNSESGRPGPQFRSCQDCHMPTHYKGKQLQFKIANSESPDQFPPTTHRLPDSDIELTERSRFSRHSLHGLNVFLNQFFQQFPLILGFQQVDWMSEQPSPLDPPAPPVSQAYIMELPLLTGFESMLEMADKETATIDIGQLQRTSQGQLRSVVTVRNLTGHYLPSGVGSRRVFLELLVLDRQGAVLWASGRTNDFGFILDGVTDRVLESEQPVKFPGAPVQPHYQVIDSGSQVQIYQELIRDSEGILTTSFLHRVEPIKDNRIRPKGFDPQFFAQSPSPYIQKLAEIPGEEAHDPYYVDPQLTGADEIEYRIPLDPETLQRADHVQVTLYIQTISPFYLQQRFQDASRGPGAKDDIQRLYYLTSHLNLNDAKSEKGEPVLKGWKLRIAGGTRQVQ